ncbi:hypothetical protein B7P43_G10369, partial [Cryptotermes secundus]
MNFMKPEPDPDGESYQSYHNENQLIDTEEDKGPIVIKFPVMNSEYEHKTDAIKLEHAAHVLPLMMAAPTEDVTDKKHYDLSPSSTIPVIKCETEFIMDVIKSERNSNSEAYVASSYSHTVMTDLKEEKDPLLITGPVTQDENESLTTNEELEVKFDSQTADTSEPHKVYFASNKTKYSCEVCKKVFSHQSELKMHIPAHSAEHPYSCDICENAFSLHVNLKRHQRVHTGE